MQGAAMEPTSVLKWPPTTGSKPLVFCTHDAENEKDVLEMALLVCGGRKKLKRSI
jgi:hypothetical protein